MTDSLSPLAEKIHREKPAVVSFVGAGGKSSILFALARELHRYSGSGEPPDIAAAVTTKLAVREIPAGFTLVMWDGGQNIQPLLASCKSEGTIPLFCGGTSEGKLTGIDPRLAGEIATAAGTLLVEADGARRCPLKRLRAHEPVIPEHAGPAWVCIVAGLDALLQPLDERSCFNLAGVVSDGIAKEGTLISPIIMRDILFQNRGYADVIPAHHQAFLLLNKIDTLPARGAFRSIARTLFHPRITSTFVTRAHADRVDAIEVTNARDRVHAVILAAGAASRFGRLKQIEPVDNTCLLAIVVTKALRCASFEKVVLVLGHESGAALRALGGLADHENLKIIINEEYEKGMSTSLTVGLAHARAAGCDAAAILLGDMPVIDSALLSTVLARYRSSSCTLCYVKTEERPGHPIIVRRDLFDEFQKIQGDIGGREIVRKHLEWALGVDPGADAAGSQFDINTTEDFEMYLSRFRGR